MAAMSTGLMRRRNAVAKADELKFGRFTTAFVACEK